MYESLLQSIVAINSYTENSINCWIRSSRNVERFAESLRQWRLSAFAVTSTFHVKNQERNNPCKRFSAFIYPSKIWKFSPYKERNCVRLRVSSSWLLYSSEQHYRNCLVTACSNKLATHWLQILGNGRCCFLTESRDCCMHAMDADAKVFHDRFYQLADVSGSTALNLLWLIL